jgi:Cof subfamily protein (haloacid dehalogenase superfamily)
VRLRRVTSWRPALVALDVDGTLCDGTDIVSDRNRRAVAAASRAGAAVVVATGRSWHETRIILEQLQLEDSLVVCSNGAVVLTYPAEELVETVTFDAAPILRMLRQIAPSTVAWVEDFGRGYRSSSRHAEIVFRGELVIEELSALSRSRVTRLILHARDADDTGLRALARAAGLESTVYEVHGIARLDIGPPGISKATGLHLSCTRLGIAPADVLAMGDSWNDREMLAWAGRGVALGDAPPEVRDAADDVTATFDADGVAQELERWFPVS